MPWLILHREGLSVLVHPSTGDGYGDHLERSLKLGEKLKLNKSVTLMCPRVSFEC